MPGIFGNNPVAVKSQAYSLKRESGGGIFTQDAALGSAFLALLNINKKEYLI